MAELPLPARVPVNCDSAPMRVPKSFTLSILRRPFWPNHDSIFTPPLHNVSPPARTKENPKARSPQAAPRHVRLGQRGRHLAHELVTSVNQTAVDLHQRGPRLNHGDGIGTAGDAARGNDGRGLPERGLEMPPDLLRAQHPRRA